MSCSLHEGSSSHVFFYPIALRIFPSILHRRLYDVNSNTEHLKYSYKDDGNNSDTTPLG